MALTDTTVRQAKATGKAYTLGDIDGLSLAVSPQGGKSWHFRYYWHGKQKRMSLGTYPEVSLREARQARDEARSLLVRGSNPQTHRKAERQAVRMACEHTFTALFQQWIEHRKPEITTQGSNCTLAKILHVFGNDVLPLLGKRSIHEIRRPDLLEIIERIERRKALSIARELRGWFNQLFRFALVKVPGLEYNPATDLDVVAVPRPPVRHHPFLHMNELPDLLRDLRKYPRAQTSLGLRLLLLTGVRTGELRHATPEQFDLERGLWSIPPENVKQLQQKAKKVGKDMPPYLVPLSRQAIEIVRELLKMFIPSQRYLLRSRHRPAMSVDRMTLNKALQQLGYKNRLTGHGIRGTLSTALNEIGYPAAWIEAQLSHADPNAIRAAYNHAEYIEQRRRMMQDWADRLDLCEQGRVEEACRHLVVHLPVLERSAMSECAQPFVRMA
jgi:integrase